MNRKGRKEMAIFITGDTHGDFSRLLPAAFHEQRDLTKEDYLIICGDYTVKNIMPKPFILH